MGNVNFVRGLKRVRAAYPLAFSPTGITDPTTGHALPTGTGILGAGYSTTYREVLGTSVTDGIGLFLGTGATSGQVTGIRVDLEGDSACDMVGVFAKIHTGSAIHNSAYALAGYAIPDSLQAGSGTIVGVGAGIEIPSDYGTAGTPQISVMELEWWNAEEHLSMNTQNAYIGVRDYSTYSLMSVLFNFHDVSPTANSATTLLATNHDHIGTDTLGAAVFIRCMYGTTPIWLLATTKAPAAS